MDRRDSIKSLVCQPFRTLVVRDSTDLRIVFKEFRTGIVLEVFAFVRRLLPPTNQQPAWPRELNAAGSEKPDASADIPWRKRFFQDLLLLPTSSYVKEPTSVPTNHPTLQTSTIHL